jgi:hypothetical protein
MKPIPVRSYEDYYDHMEKKYGYTFKKFTEENEFVFLDREGDEVKIPLIFLNSCPGCTGGTDR